MTINFRNGNQCKSGEEWIAREMTAEEVEIVTDMVRGYENVTVTGIHICEKGINVWLAVNYLSRAKYPKNHREYMEYRSMQKAEWQGWF